jgi:hypothetical protein
MALSLRSQARRAVERTGLEYFRIAAPRNLDHRLISVEGEVAGYFDEQVATDADAELVELSDDGVTVSPSAARD